MSTRAVFQSAVAIVAGLVVVDKNTGGNGGPALMGILDKLDSTSKPLDRNRVLIVDDEAPIRQLFHMILASSLSDLKIDEACNGLEAVRLFEESHHGVVLMDLRMPEMDGVNAFMAIQNICRQERLRIPHVVFCTGFAPPGTVQDIVAGGDYHGLLQKPARSDEIVEAVRVRLQAG